MRIAIIPARGGSKRIPRKNVKAFGGKPMLAYAISVAKASGLFDRIIVSSDDREVIRLANALGAETPFIRPADISDDITPTVPVIAHAIRCCRERGWDLKEVCCVYPAVPLLLPEDLQHALRLQHDSASMGYCFSVAEFPSVLQRALRLLPGGKTVPFFDGNELIRTQDLERAYYDAGQFYWATPETWLSNPNIHRGGIGFVIPPWRAIDIDTPDDWERAELYFQGLSAAKEKL